MGFYHFLQTKTTYFGHKMRITSCGSVFGLYKQLIHRRKHNTFKIERYKKVQ